METSTPPHRAQPLFHRRGRRLAAAVTGVFLLVAVLVMGATWAGWPGDADVAVDPVPSPVDGLTAEEREYHGFVAPRLHELGAQARELARLGEERSRNIFELQAHAGRLRELVTEIDAFLAPTVTPPRFQVAEEHYREGVRLTERAMDEAERALLSADWERLGRAVAVFTAGAEEIESAAAALETDGEIATPVADRDSPEFASNP